MTKLIAKAILGKREPGELGYYKRLKRVESNINKFIGDVFSCLFISGCIASLIIAWLIYG